MLIFFFCLSKVKIKDVCRKKARQACKNSILFTYDVSRIKWKLDKLSDLPHRMMIHLSLIHI